MKRIRLFIAVMLLILTGVIAAMATEEAPYTIINTDDIFELREYAPQVRTFQPDCANGFRLNLLYCLFCTDEPVNLIV
jgi:hypothetical protein